MATMDAATRWKHLLAGGGLKQGRNPTQIMEHLLQIPEPDVIFFQGAMRGLLPEYCTEIFNPDGGVGGETRQSLQNMYDAAGRPGADAN